MAEDPIKAVLHYAQALKAPRIRDSAARLAEQARDANWTHEEYLAAVLSREVAAREASGAATRIRSAGFPTRKSLEDFNFDHQPGTRDMIAHLGTGAFLAKSRNVVLLGPPGTGKTHLAIGLAIKAAQAGHRIAFATAVDWVARLKAAHNAARLPAELAKLRRIGLLVVDEVGYIPFEQDAANLFLTLFSVWLESLRRFSIAIRRSRVWLQSVRRICGSGRMAARLLATTQPLIEMCDLIAV
ncbi:ATP-binding protein [Mycobacterium asiaticum]|uniref:ATP-binding protein n=1 Tax=Mycobacterium asiaticum TaxID=1790 RepID=UPI000A7D086B|nr:ATP-binding protein [Mycobacterium asiaticum]